MLPTDISIREVRSTYEDYLYRTPIKFGGVALDRVTLLNVHMLVETRQGQRQWGFGSMPMGNVWAWPSRTLTYAQTLAFMKDIAQRIGKAYSQCQLMAHPIHITHALEADHFFNHADRVDSPDPVPKLVTLVAASAFDAALHDAYGKVHGRSCYATYSSAWLGSDLHPYLGPEFSAINLNDFILQQPRATMPMYHLVGALDPLTASDVQNPVNDDLPECLADWIQSDGLTHLKIKLNGDDLSWDLDRVIAVDRVADLQPNQQIEKSWSYSLDFNERCQSVDYLLEFLQHLAAKRPLAYARIQYIEQPTARDLKAHPDNRMHRAAEHKPIVIDESLTDRESLELAQEMGYTGVALKACKGQTQSLLFAVLAKKMGLFLTVQDLTCPGASLIHSAGLAAHIPGVAAIEANSRQYVPSANRTWDVRFPGIFTIRNGVMATGQMNGPGLSALSISDSVPH